MRFRVGLGYDVHRLAEGEEFWLGGLLIPHEKGTVGHSDADVLLHAISDALLGASGQRDIGYHFPDTNPIYKGADSKLLLKEVGAIVAQAGYRIGNIDATVALQVPKIKPYIAPMQSIIANVLEVEEGAISVKATTTEWLGFEGREEGVSAQAVCLIYKT